MALVPVATARKDWAQATAAMAGRPSAFRDRVGRVETVATTVGLAEMADTPTTATAAVEVKVSLAVASVETA